MGEEGGGRLTDSWVGFRSFGASRVRGWGAAEGGGEEMGGWGGLRMGEREMGAGTE